MTDKPDRWHAAAPPPRALDLAAMAENCEAAAARLAQTENDADHRDGKALAAAAAKHRQDAERERPATYWWHDR